MDGLDLILVPRQSSMMLKSLPDQRLSSGMGLKEYSKLSHSPKDHLPCLTKSSKQPKREALQSLEEETLLPYYRK
jgi:hypothetical protein